MHKLFTQGIVDVKLKIGNIQTLFNYLDQTKTFPFFKQERNLNFFHPSKKKTTNKQKQTNSCTTFFKKIIYILFIFYLYFKDRLGITWSERLIKELLKKERDQNVQLLKYCYRKEKQQPQQKTNKQKTKKKTGKLS